MPSASYVNILHISDFHLNPENGVEGVNQRNILKALIDDLDALRTSNHNIDLILFSGDIVFSADQDQYDEAAGIIKQIVDSSGLSLEDIIVCPGNHDAHQIIAKSFESLVTELRAHNVTPDSVNKIMHHSKSAQYFGFLFKSYNSFAKRYGPKPVVENSYLTSYNIDKSKIFVIVINTAILSFAGNSGLPRDEGHLLFPDHALNQALEQRPAGYKTIILGHHPLNVLGEASQQPLKALISKHADAYFFGHMHSAMPEFYQSPLGNCINLQSGALYQGRGRWNGYSIVSLLAADSAAKIQYRKWHEVRLGFGVASDLEDTGTIFLPSKSQSLWSKVTERPEKAAMESWRINSLLPYINEECSKTLSNLPIDEVFVEPEFERDHVVEGNTTRIKQIVKFDEIRSDHRNYIIAAANETGKTTLLNFWSRQLAEQDATDASWRVPVVVNYTSFSKSVNGVETRIKAGLADLPSGVSAKSLLESGLVTIFIDDFDLIESPVKESFERFAKKFPRCRYVIVTSTPFLLNAGVRPVIAQGLDFEIVKVRDLKNKQLLALIENHGTRDPMMADKLMNRVVLEAKALSVPITPVTGTFLIQIYTENASGPLINRASLIERYVEILLEKFGPEDLIEGAFDFVNKADLLGEISEAMCRSNVYRVDEAIFIGWIDEYVKRYGFRYSPVDLVNYFIRARVLARFGGKIAFRLIAFQQFFAARRMSVNEGFREFVLAEERYLVFFDEISFYAAISRRDVKWVRELVRRYKSGSDLAFRDVSDTVRSNTFFDSFELPKLSADEEELYDIERLVLHEGDSSDRREQMLDSAVGMPAVSSTNYARNEPDSAGDDWIGQLILLSSTVKHMELIPSEEKSAIVSQCIEGWNQFAALSLGCIPELLRSRAMTISGIKYEVNLPDNLSNSEIARRLLVTMPVAVISMVHDIMGTEKLRGQIEIGDVCESSQESTMGGIFRVGILSHMCVDDIDRQLEIAAEKVKSSIYLSDVLLRLMYELITRFRLPESQVERIKNIYVDTRTRLEGVDASRLAIRKSEIISNLNKQRLLISIDPNA